MTREEEMWKTVEEEHGELSRREAMIALTAMEWADETMIDKACLYLKEALINTRDNFGDAVVASFDTIDLDGFIEEFRKELKGE